MSELEGIASRGALFCKLESIDTDFEFSEGRCMRFIGVSERQFNADSFQKGVEAVVIDLPIDEGMKHFRASIELCNSPDDCAICWETANAWFRVDFKVSHSGAQFELGYLYSCFGVDAPISIVLLSITRERGFKLPGFPLYRLDDWSSVSSDWTCSTFEVGQGMASLVYSEAEGFLIDAGAGTPIKRKNYTSGSLGCNDLLARVKGRTLTFVLSHGDEDHWRILRWDPGLRGQILQFVIPDNRPRIAFFDKTIKQRIRHLSVHARLSLSTGVTLSLFRTSPATPTSNNDGIVVLFEKDGGAVLMPGDCVYSELAIDNCPSVRALAARSYHALVVPHHGDLASAKRVPPANNPGVSVAFFSAGNHLRYQHPTQASQLEHDAAGYLNFSNTKPAGIVEHKLS